MVTLAVPGLLMVALPPTTEGACGPASACPMPSGSSAVVARARLRNGPDIRLSSIARRHDEEEARTVLVVPHQADRVDGAGGRRHGARAGAVGLGHVQVRVKLIVESEPHPGAEERCLRGRKCAIPWLNIRQVPVTSKSIELRLGQYPGRDRHVEAKPPARHPAIVAEKRRRVEGAAVETAAITAQFRRQQRLSRLL